MAHFFTVKGINLYHIENLDPIKSKSLDAVLDVCLDNSDDVQEHGVVDLVDGVIRTEDPNLLSDSIVNESRPKFEAELFDQTNQKVFVYVRNYLRKCTKNCVNE